MLSSALIVNFCAALCRHTTRIPSCTDTLSNADTARGTSTIVPEPLMPLPQLPQLKEMVVSAWAFDVPATTIAMTSSSATM